jgi:hypothetical protein
MASITPALRRIKGELSTCLPPRLIYQACRDAGHAFRQRELDPAQLLYLFILQVLSFNTAISHLRHLGAMAVSGAAYCKARMRLPLAAVQNLLLRSAQAMLREVRSRDDALQTCWCGLRTYLVDGSSAITPHTETLDKHFGHPTGQKKGCSLPVAKVLGLFDAFSGMVVHLVCTHLFVNEMKSVWRVHPLLGKGDLLVGDRGFCSFVHLALLSAAGVLACFRLHGCRKECDFRRGRKVKRLGRNDRIVLWHKPMQKPKWMKRRQYARLPDSLVVRLIRYHTPVALGRRTRVVTVATTLLDPTLYPAEKIAQLYGLRWRVETHFGQLKTTLKMRRLKCRTVEGVLKELAVYCLVFNLVQRIMAEAAARQRVTPERISFLDTVRWLLSAAPGMPPELMVNPLRLGRHEPRVIKDLLDTYRKMTRPRAYLKRHLALTKR